MAIFFHFLRQNKIDKAFSVLSKYRRLFPQLLVRRHMFKPQQTVYMHVLIFVGSSQSIFDILK